MPISRSSLSKRLLAAIIAIVVVVIVVGTFAGYYLTKKSTTNEVPVTVTIGVPVTTTITNTYTVQSLQALNNILPSSYVFSLSAGQYLYMNFTVPSYATNAYVNGSYTSTNGVAVLILTPVEFGAFTQNQWNVINSGDYVWYSGYNGGATIDASLVPGQTYYLVFYDGNLIHSDTITVISPITLWGYVPSEVTSTTTIVTTSYTTTVTYTQVS